MNPTELRAQIDDIEQMCLNIVADGGEYYNFFFTPGGIGSLASYLKDGWKLIFIKDAPEDKKAVVVFYRATLQAQLKKET